jgi:hypothetical protein
LVVRPIPVTHFSERVIVNPYTRAFQCDQLNVLTGDILGAVLLEMELKNMGFKGTVTDYSAGYKAIYGEDPPFFTDAAKGGILDKVKKIENTGNGVVSYCYIQGMAPDVGGGAKVCSGKAE